MIGSKKHKPASGERRYDPQRKTKSVSGEEGATGKAKATKWPIDSECDHPLSLGSGLGEEEEFDGKNQGWEEASDSCSETSSTLLQYDSPTEGWAVMDLGTEDQVNSDHKTKSWQASSSKLGKHAANRDWRKLPPTSHAGREALPDHSSRSDRTIAGEQRRADRTGSASSSVHYQSETSKERGHRRGSWPYGRKLQANDGSGGATSQGSGSDLKGNGGSQGGGDVGGIARVGRAFDVLESAEETWDAVFDTLLQELRAAGHHTLRSKRRTKTLDKSRHNYGEIVCAHSGSARAAVPELGAKRRKRVSKKVGCPFKISIWWGVRASTPSISTSDCRHNHDKGGALGRTPKNVLPSSSVGDHVEDIRKWTSAGLRAPDMCKLLEIEHGGLVLCKIGKRKVRNTMQRFKQKMHLPVDDVANFLGVLEREPGMFVRSKSDAEGRLLNVFWATADQQEKMERFGDCIQLDTTVLMNRYSYPLLLIVGVDDSNRSCVLGQGLLRSECSETFEWFLDTYETAAYGRRPEVILTDPDLALTTAVSSSWKSTLHLYSSWHVLQHVSKKCSSSFPDVEERQGMLELFKQAAQAATPETFEVHRARLQSLVGELACKHYMDDLTKNKTKWAFSCRPTALTLGMGAVERVEGLLGAAKRAGVGKSPSLCALWEGLQRLNKMVEFESARLAEPPNGSHVSSDNNEVDDFYKPIKEELERVGASDYCIQDLRDEVVRSDRCNVLLIDKGTVDDDGEPLPLDATSAQQIREAHPYLNFLVEGPPDTDLEADCAPGLEATAGSSVWARTSLAAFMQLVARVPITFIFAVQSKLITKRLSHLVVFGPGNFHLCSCLKLLRCGRPCMHYMSVLTCFGVSTAACSFDHHFDGDGVHPRWRESLDEDEAWSVSQALKSAVHEQKQGGLRGAHDDDYRGPASDNISQGGVDRPEPAEKVVRDRRAGDERRAFTNMMAMSKDYVDDLLGTVTPDEAQALYGRMGEYLKVLNSGSNAGQKTPEDHPLASHKRKPRKGDWKGRVSGGERGRRTNQRLGQGQAFHEERQGDSSPERKRHKDSRGTCSGGPRPSAPKRRRSSDVP